MAGKIKIALGILILMGIVLSAARMAPKNTETIYLPGNLIRLHVVANSDSNIDQDLKRKVRDEIVQCMAPSFLNTRNIDSARTIARNNLDHIGEVSLNKIRSEGKDYPVRVELGSFAFPTKHYGAFVLPAGDYEAVRVTIGAGGGANWWCVLFPPLCFVDLSGAAPNSLKENSSPPQETLPDNLPETKKSLAAAASLGKSGLPAAEEPVSVRVEFRFKIIDLLKKLSGERGC